MSNKGLVEVLSNFEKEVVEVKETKNSKKRQKYIDIMKNYHSNDPKKKKQATEEFIFSMSKYVYNIINKYFSSYSKHMEDLYQEGVLAILSQLDKYNPELAMPSTYFHIHIISAINTYIINNINNTTNYYGHNIIKIKKAIKKFETQNKDYTNADIAKETDLPVETVLGCMNIIKYSNEVRYDAEEYIENQISSQVSSPEDMLIDKEKSGVIYKAMAMLNEDERYLIIHKLGFIGEKMSYKTLAENLNISTDKARKKYQIALIKLKNKTEFKKYFGNGALSEEEKILEDAEISFLEDDIAYELLEEIEEFEIDLADII